MVKNTIKILTVLTSLSLLFLLFVNSNRTVSTVTINSPRSSVKQVEHQPETYDFSKYITTMDRPLEDYKKEEPVKITVIPNYNTGSTFKLTAYCSCYNCCGQYALNRPDGIVYTASGARAVAGITKTIYCGLTSCVCFNKT